MYDIDVEVLGQGVEWVGGNMNYAGGGQKINLLREKINELMKSDDKEQIIIFTDRYVTLTHLQLSCVVSIKLDLMTRCLLQL